MGGTRTTARVSTLLVPLLVAASLLPAATAASDPNECDEPGEAPDLIVGALDNVQAFGSIDGVSAYAIGATTCNTGTCWADWFFSTPAHPVFAQNLFRLADGRFEQLGQSWVAHRFFALSGTLCEPGCIPTDGTHLGVRCSTSNSASATGDQTRLGPKSEVRAGTGSILYPFTGLGETGNHIYKRLQVRDDDLDPAQNPEALYFAEGQTVTADDAAAGNAHDNASYRRVVVGPTGGPYSLSFSGATQIGDPAIVAWAVADPEVMLEIVDVPGDGRYYVASRATPVGEDRWHYEYAVQNLDSDRGARSVRVPVPAGSGITNPGFHDVDYHSGEPFDGTDWQIEIVTAPSAHAVVWSTETFEVNPDANALRWGTLYNFRFDADAPPVTGELSLVLFEPGDPSAASVPAMTPRLCDGDGACEAGEGPCSCAADCGIPPVVEAECSNGSDDDCDGLGDCLDPDCCGGIACPSEDDDGDTYLACEDCDDSDPAIWALPEEVASLGLATNTFGWTVLSWEPPAAPGCSQPAYELLRSSDPADFLQADCIDPGDPIACTAFDTAIPDPGSFLSYLVRARNGCPAGGGPLGLASDGSPRIAGDCPEQE